MMAGADCGTGQSVSRLVPVKGSDPVDAHAGAPHDAGDPLKPSGCFVESRSAREASEAVKRSLTKQAGSAGAAVTRRRAGRGRIYQPFYGGLHRLVAQPLEAPGNLLPQLDV